MAEACQPAVPAGADQLQAPTPVSTSPEVATLMDMCTGHWKQQALRAAVKLGVFDAFTNPDLPLGVDQIAIATGVLDMQYLYRLLRYLCQYELFLELDGQGFALMELGQYMRSAHPSGLCYAAVSFGEPAHYIPWMHLEQAVKQATGAFQYFRPDLPGGVFQYMSLPENKKEEDEFNKLMTTFTKTMDSPAKLHDFSGHVVVADIGGGYGELLMEIMALTPGVIQGIVFEMPAVVDMAPQPPSNFQITWVKGDFFKEIRVKADCYVMKSILHDWTDECCVKILTNLKATMMPGSILVNFDRLMPDYDNCTPGAPHPAKAMDMNMMVMCNGKERTQAQWQALMTQAGFTIKSITQSPDMAAIVAVPAS